MFWLRTFESPSEWKYIYISTECWVQSERARERERERERFTCVYRSPCLPLQSTVIVVVSFLTSSLLSAWRWEQQGPHALDFGSERAKDGSDLIWSLMVIYKRAFNVGILGSLSCLLSLSLSPLCLCCLVFISILPLTPHFSEMVCFFMCDVEWREKAYCLLGFPLKAKLFTD